MIGEKNNEPPCTGDLLQGYNVVYFKETSIVIGLYGLAKRNKNHLLIGLMLFAYTFMDRAIGTGLKYFDGF